MDSYDFNINIQMPSSFFSDDEKWIREMLLHLDPSTRSKITLKYAEVFQNTWESEPIMFKKNNRARHEANTRLRIFVRKYAAYSKGYVSDPELLTQH